MSKSKTNLVWPVTIVVVAGIAAAAFVFRPQGGDDDDTKPAAEATSVDELYSDDELKKLEEGAEKAPVANVKSDIEKAKELIDGGKVDDGLERLEDAVLGPRGESQRTAADVFDAKAADASDYWTKKAEAILPDLGDTLARVMVQHYLGRAAVGDDKKRDAIEATFRAASAIQSGDLRASAYEGLAESFIDDGETASALRSIDEWAEIAPFSSDKQRDFKDLAGLSSRAGDEDRYERFLADAIAAGSRHDASATRLHIAGRAYNKAEETFDALTASGKRTAYDYAAVVAWMALAGDRDRYDKARILALRKMDAEAAENGRTRDSNHCNIVWADAAMGEFTRAENRLSLCGSVRNKSLMRVRIACFHADAKAGQRLLSEVLSDEASDDEHYFIAAFKVGHRSKGDNAMRPSEFLRWANSLEHPGGTACAFCGYVVGP